MNEQHVVGSSNSCNGPPFTVDRYGSLGESIIAERDWLRGQLTKAEQWRDYYRAKWMGPMAMPQPDAPSDETSEEQPCVSHVAMKEYERRLAEACERLRRSAALVAMGGDQSMALAINRHSERLLGDTPAWSEREAHKHTDQCWEPDSGCDMGRNEAHALKANEPAWDCACNEPSCAYCGPRVAQSEGEQR